MRECDLAVVGGGTAGLAAGLFGSRYGLNTIVLEQLMPGGQIVNEERIENYPGFPDGISGFELGAQLQAQAVNNGCAMEMIGVTGVSFDEPYLLLELGSETLRAKAVIVAAGSTNRRLGVPGEAEYEGRGVSHCASCDGPLFGGDVVGVVGGGDSAADEALTLTEYASRVILFHRRDQLRAQHILRDRVIAQPKIEVRWYTEVKEVLGGEKGVSAVRVQDTRTGAAAEVRVSGLFAYVGLDPQSAFLRGIVELDNAGHVVTDACMRASKPGIYAAGDIRMHSAAQLITSAGDGATAAIYAARYIQLRSWPSR